MAVGRGVEIRYLFDEGIIDSGDRAALNIFEPQLMLIPDDNGRKMRAAFEGFQISLTFSGQRRIAQDEPFEAFPIPGGEQRSLRVLETVANRAGAQIP